MWHDYGREIHESISKPPFLPDDREDWSDEDERWAVLVGLFGDNEAEEDECST
jgi:hypothetical protein